ncbi:carboxypeptidase-like regulatory domain-containing protein, partial [Massilibacteroides sp.]|uniref:carboxypeptidase-like regulatory domain-containing protein n=1 Tax=Massilibacteroides sp. TaxID=2034766 RepID=UPI00262A92A3
MKPHVPYIKVLLVCMLLFTYLPIYGINPNDPLDQKITLPRAKGTIYQLLNKITEQTNLLFIYDSRIINNEQKANISKGQYTIREAIYKITQNPTLSLRLIDNHILIHLPTEFIEKTAKKTDSIPPVEYFTITGTLYDKDTQEPIIYASVGVMEAGIGTITNQEGEFRLRLPLSYRAATLHFSHLGYRPEDISCEILADKYSTFALEPNTVSLQEVIVRAVNPRTLLNEMLYKRKENYVQTSVYLTSFYREGIERKKGMVALSEGIFKIHKTPFSSHVPDQVKLLKMRRVSNINERDTIITKIKSGINACLMLDIIKQVPDFLRAEEESPYIYTHSSITVIDNRYVDVISFEQKKTHTEPLYKGNLYIDKENKALLKAEFEIQPDHIKKATNMFVERKSRNLQITPIEIKYTISYKNWNGKYYISHVRGDLNFKIKKKRQLFSSTNLHTWFEMVTCKIEENDVSRFSRSETLSTRTIFAETKFEYDNNFWGEFNIIIPESELNEA